MASTINASSSAGIVTTADTSAILQLQTAGTAALTIDASANVGIGTASPGAKLSVTKASNYDVARLTAPDYPTLDLYQSAQTNASARNWRILTNYEAWGQLDIQVGTTSADAPSVTRLSINSSGNVGIGTASPTSALEVSKASVIGKFKSTSDNSTYFQIEANNGAGSAFYVGQDSSTGGSFGKGAYAAVVWQVGARPMIFATSNSERMRITDGGQLQLGSTNTNNSTVFSVQGSASANVCGIRVHTNGNAAISFLNSSAGESGYIQVNASTVSYVTSSDYRLKEAIAPMTGALAKVALLKPCTYKWKVDGSDGQGFIAHELADVVPQCVSGEKDAVGEQQYEVTPAVKDEEGNTVTEAVIGTRIAPVYQGIDTSFLVATLTAAIQELKAIVDAQGAEIAALKGATA